MALVLGTAAGDFLTAGNDGDEIRGLAGNDTILGGEGLDTLNGNEGQDLVVGRFGADRVYGGQGNDTVVATAGGMIVNGNKGDDLVIGFGNSTVFGGQANDTIYGAEGTANGDLGADLIFGGATMNGGADPDPDSSVPAGNDTLVGSRGNNTMTGGRGNDQFVFQPEVVATFNLTFERPVFNNIAGANQVTVTEGGYGGADVINDFAAGPGTGDIVKLVALDLGSTVTIEQVGPNVRITIAGTTSPDGLGANAVTTANTPGQASPTNQSAAQTITINNVNILDFLATGSEDLEINGQIINTATPGLVVVNPNNNNSFRFTVSARQGRNIDLSRTGIIGTRLDADFAPDGVPFPSVNNDTINGTGGRDSIAGLAGNDVITSGSGNDTVRGGPGDDTIWGQGNDAADPGKVVVTSDGRTLTINVTDILFGEDGNDSILGEGPNSSNEGPDFIDGGAGDDSLFGNGDSDTIFGGAGNDSIQGNPGPDSLVGGVGNDTINGGPFDSSNDTIFGEDGNDVLFGDGGNDSIYGGAGNDSILGEDGEDTLLGEAGNDTIYGGAGRDSILGGDGDDTLSGEGDNDTIRGGSGNDSLFGEQSNDLLEGGSGNDSIDGGVENQLFTVVGIPLNALNPAGKNNLIDVPDGDPALGAFPNGVIGDVVSYIGNTTAGVTISLLTGVATSTDSGTDGIKDIEHVVGSNFRDNIAGDNFANLLIGLVGDDTINGNGGNDWISGGEGDDSLLGGVGDDTINASDGNDTLVGGLGSDLLTGGRGSDRFVFNATNEGVDVITDFLVSAGGAAITEVDLIVLDTNGVLPASGVGQGFGGTAGLTLAQAATNPSPTAGFILGIGGIPAAGTDLGFGFVDPNGVPLPMYFYDLPTGRFGFDPDGAGPAGIIDIAVLPINLVPNTPTGAEAFASAVVFV